MAGGITKPPETTVNRKVKRPTLRELNRLSTDCYAAEETFTAADRLEDALNRVSWLTLRIYDFVWTRKVGVETRKPCMSCGQLAAVAHDSDPRRTR